MLATSSYAQAPYMPYGDPPTDYRMYGDVPFDPACMRWNWQEQSWYDICPGFVYRLAPRRYDYRSPLVVKAKD